MRPEIPSPALQYIRDVFAGEDKVLTKVRESAPVEKKGMQIGPEEGKLLYVLATMVQAGRIVEIGTFMGYSALWMARALPKGGKLFTIESDPVHARHAAQHFKEAQKDGCIQLCQGNAHEVLPSLNKEGPFDMVFIDADKGSYTTYLDWAEQHIRKGGLIVGDNTFLFGTVYADKKPEGVAAQSYTAMREFNARLADTTRYASILLPTFEGMTVAVKL